MDSGTPAPRAAVEADPGFVHLALAHAPAAVLPGADIDTLLDGRVHRVALPGLNDPAELPALAQVEVRRSARRRRTVTAYRQDDRTIVLMPASFSQAEERHWISQMVAKLEIREDRRRRTFGGDGDLMVRALRLADAHLDGVRPVSVRWVDNQHRRWGSCTPSARTIRLSIRLRDLPGYVVDYVLVHELAHLIEPGHDEAFWSLVSRYPLAERALGYLEGVESRPGVGPPDAGDCT